MEFKNIYFNNSYQKRQVYTVNDISASLNRMIKKHYQEFFIEGELSSCKPTNYNVVYFQLKDKKSLMDGRFYMQNINPSIKLEQLKDGTHIIGRFKIEYDIKNGKPYLSLLQIVNDSEGIMYQKMLETKKQLQQEGLFDIKHKKKTPKYCFDVGVICAIPSSAFNDILKTLRYATMNITPYPTTVQGDSAPQQMINALKLADSKNHDVIIFGRGGGSKDDLWAFNDEQLCRTIFAMNTPVIVGVGHASDHSLVELVADMYKVTPTAAAQEIAFNYQEMLDDLSNHFYKLKNKIDFVLHSYKIQLNNSIKSTKIFLERINNQNDQLNNVEQRLYQSITTILERGTTKINMYEKSFQQYKNSLILFHKKNLSEYERQLSQQMNHLIEKAKFQLESLQKLNNAISPVSVLERGYSIVKKDNHTVNNVEMIEINDELEITMWKGKMKVRVNEIVDKGNRNI